MQPLQNNRFGAYLNQQHFLGTLILAFLLHAGGVGGLFAYGLYALGLPTSIVHLGYRFGYFIDMNA